jgi:hypothetical protein
LKSFVLLKSPANEKFLDNFLRLGGEINYLSSLSATTLIRLALETLILLGEFLDVIGAEIEADL